MTPKEKTDIILQRLISAREAVGLSLTEAAHRMGFNNYQTLSDIEKGKRSISANELIVMARLYSRDLDYFFTTQSSPGFAPLWRKEPGTREKDTKSIQREFCMFLERYSNLEHTLGLKRRWKDIQTAHTRDDFAEEEYSLVSKLASYLYKQLGLGARPALNLLNVLENDLRFKILHLPLEGVSGACNVDDSLGVGILINKKDAPWRRNFDLAHELFHVVSWDIFSREEIGDGTVKTKPEKYADAFASILLLPEEQLMSALEEVVTNNIIRVVDIIELAIDFGVSTAAVLWRLVNLGKIKDAQAKEILENPEIREMDRSHRRDLWTEDVSQKYPNRFTSLACRCLMEGKITRGAFANYLEIERHDVDSFLVKSGFAEEHYEEIGVA